MAQRDLTVVYRVAEGDEAAAITSDPRIVSLCWSHAIHERDSLMRTAGKANDEIERLRRAIKLMLGRAEWVPWSQVPDAEVEAWLKGADRLAGDSRPRPPQEGDASPTTLTPDSRQEDES